MASAVVLLAACSSTSTNDAPSSGGSGGGAGAPSCVDAGTDCYACCKSPSDDGDGALLWAEKQCVCSAGDSACKLECCGASISALACALCVKAHPDVAGCVATECSNAANCMRFRTCLNACL